MKTLIFLPLLFAIAAVSFAQDEPRLVFPRHVEVPVYPYPQIARAAHVSGEVAINVTIDADGKVVRTEVVSGNPLLWKASTDNIQKWTFSKPPHGPLTQTMFYVYKLDGISKDNAALAKVSFDLPDHVNIVATFFTVQTQNPGS